MNKTNPGNHGMGAFIGLAREYHQDVHAAARGSVGGEPEAQLTAPFSNLIRRLTDAAGLGSLQLVRESRLDRTRPDFAVLRTYRGRTRQHGYIELKAPDVTVDASQWAGRNARQWETMQREAEVLLICNGRLARMYLAGEPQGLDAVLPYDDPETWDSAGLVQLIRRFLDARPAPVTSVRDLSQRLAIRTADLRDRLLWLLEQTGEAGNTARGGYESWMQHVHPLSSHKDFADGVSQVIAYGMVLAALSVTGADADEDGYITVAEARAAIRHTSPVMAAAFAPLVDKPALFEAAKVELGALETLISAIDPHRVNRSADRRGEPWLYFYEDFLSVYDPEERRQAGVYYTPTAVVQAMVRIVDHLLVERFGIQLGFADSQVVTLDPATGTGTFPLAILDRAADRVAALRGPAGRAQAATNLSRNLFAFELLPGPYSVAHLRLNQRLAELESSSGQTAQVVLTDTLESPLDPQPAIPLFGDAEVLAAEQNRAARIKLEQRVTVVIGNPPYRRVERAIEGRGSGGWVLDGRVPGRSTNNSLFDDILDVARANTNFAHHASLYNLYVYFWRWAIWKAFDAHDNGPAIVALITASSWLTGPGFIGLRQLAREVCDDCWVLDLGGDNHGANPEENVFAIETPVAIVILARRDTKDRTLPGRVHYRRVHGTAAEKLSAMLAILDREDPLSGDWHPGPDGWMLPLAPVTGRAAWRSMPALADLFPWQQPGCKLGRTWPIAPDPALLRQRWSFFAAAPLTNKPALFVTATAGRNITTRVAGYVPLNTLVGGEAHEPIVRYGYRSFDRQWTFMDPRLAKTESPSLWDSLSERQLFFVAPMTKGVSAGPCLTVTCDVPDLHFFRGSFGGKDIIPLYRDRESQQANLTLGLSDALGETIGIASPPPEDVAAYVYALLSATQYENRFREELITPGPRVPLTADAELWREAVRIGRHLIWLHTWAQRLQDSDAGRPTYIPVVESIRWDVPITRMPQTSADISYDNRLQTLHVGDGRVSGVRQDMWDYSVSGMPVLSKWLGYRTVKGSGRAASSTNPLDRIRPTVWPDEWNDELLDLLRILTFTLDMQDAQSDLLDRICSGPLISADALPQPRAAERIPPR